MTRVVFLVPRRADGGHRDELWAFARRRWESLFPDWPIFEGHHDDGPFNRSAALNLAADLADEDGRWDVAITIDSDVLLRRSQVAAAVESALAGRVTWAHRRWRGIREDWTKRLVSTGHDFGPEIDHDDMDVLVERTNPLSWSCCIAIPRAAWDRLGGFDERFRGWGFEDMAFQSAVVGLLPHGRIEGDVYHLWHPRSDERIVQGENALTASPDYVENGRLGRRYMVALRRDHSETDRPTPTDAEEMARDIANLVRDDRKFEVLARRHGRPDWSDWWPTLEELVDGAKEARFGTPAVALIVRTGGEDETWAERSGYLRRSLASLVENVSGPIQRRVIYADWSDPFRAELDEIASAHGFYVVGSGHHGYTDSVRRLWRYVDARVSEPFVFMVEDDFIYDRPVDLAPLLQVLRRQPLVRQIALLRGPCYPRELEGDGILGWPREKFTARDAGTDRARLEHRLFWTMNPSLFARSVVQTPWPARVSSERAFGDALLRDPKARFAFAGDGEPWITHIGEVRSSDAY